MATKLPWGYFNESYIYKQADYFRIFYSIIAGNLEALKTILHLDKNLILNAKGLLYAVASCDSKPMLDFLEKCLPEVFALNCNDNQNLAHLVILVGANENLAWLLANKSKLLSKITDKE